ncbi:hypothetical protein L861_02805 [Litchfieldella anticariensis FP35 = DSM 16096]|uniref:Uncharacterized protein n=1 Tax=Litchfieldella anticariensis (strain DSM 16096 / CECT 5854 / CIP 108499 / LMG 22089 / FP35) TaxID=1121939 RepID=S2L8U8_LITA3|nr:hypothetical protein L861_02805 [Halomonas anticariensis FP35 = DSM 16096]
MGAANDDIVTENGSYPYVWCSDVVERISFQWCCRDLTGAWWPRDGGGSWDSSTWRLCALCGVIGAGRADDANAANAGIIQRAIWHEYRILHDVVTR